MQSETFIHRIGHLLSKNETSKAIRMLHELLKDSPKLDEAILHSAQHHDLLQQIRWGVVDENSAGKAKNLLRLSILGLLHEIEREENFEDILAELDHRNTQGEYEMLSQKINTNRGVGTSEILNGKTSADLGKTELKLLFGSARTRRQFSDKRVKAAKLTAQEKLVHLTLAANGHLFKGTFFCLGKAHEIQAIDFTAGESKFIVFKGTKRVHFLVLETVHGNLVQQFEKMLELLQVNIPLRRDVVNSEDFYAIPFVAFKELLANAFIHRSFDPKNLMSIQVELFDDRLEIKSPGLFPGNQDLDNISVSNAVNPTIAAIFFLYGHIEKSGTGISRAKEALAEAEMLPPVLHQDSLLKYSQLTIFR
ncbi:MAG: ATP-binding protein [Saprospiraceae bacterium]